MPFLKIFLLIYLSYTLPSSAERRAGDDRENADTTHCNKKVRLLWFYLKFCLAHGVTSPCYIVHSALIFERVTRTFFVYCPECYSGILRKLWIIQNILPIHNRSCARRWFAVYPPPLRLTPYTLHPLGQLLPNDSGTFSKKVLFLRFPSFIPPLFLPRKRPRMNQRRTKEHRKNSQSSKSAVY